jgi:hypothetical protein
MVKNSTVPERRQNATTLKMSGVVFFFDFSLGRGLSSPTKKGGALSHHKNLEMPIKNAGNLQTWLAVLNRRRVSKINLREELGEQ